MLLLAAVRFPFLIHIPTNLVFALLFCQPVSFLDIEYHAQSHFSSHLVTLNSLLNLTVYRQVNYLSINHPGQLSVPSIRGRQIEYWPVWLGLRWDMLTCVRCCLRWVSYKEPRVPFDPFLYSGTLTDQTGNV